MKHIIPSVAFTLVGIILILFIATSTTSDLFRESTAQVFLICGLISIGLYLIIVLLILISCRCPHLRQTWPIKLLTVRSPSQDISEYTSILLPIGVSFLIASGNATDPRYPWLDDAYDLATCLLIAPTLLFLSAAMYIYRRERLDQQPEADSNDLPSE